MGVGEDVMGGVYVSEDVLAGGWCQCVCPVVGVGVCEGMVLAGVSVGGWCGCVSVGRRRMCVSVGVGGGGS